LGAAPVSGRPMWCAPAWRRSWRLAWRCNRPIAEAVRLRREIEDRRAGSRRHHPGGHG
jgi:hypothetical protein